MQKVFWVITGFLLSAGEAFAGLTGDAVTTLPNPLGPTTDSFSALLTKVLDNIVTPIGGIVAVFFIIYAGFLFVTAGANEKKRGDANKALLYAVIGTAILIGAQALSKVITNTIDLLK